MLCGEAGGHVPGQGRDDTGGTAIARRPAVVAGGDGDGGGGGGSSGGGGGGGEPNPAVMVEVVEAVVVEAVV